MKLMFKDSQDRERFVASVNTEQEAYKQMTDYVKSLNPNFKIHYVRSWGENPKVFDVGSHSEFFHLYDS